ncbi:hypothetical protein O6H91_15G017400 [Diphasiastrum complanatum]|uniref:Uncharacterized protein n=1 Tax=Diphasiastrum complanatum TaxID=34168 RepID=A0ACC2BG81_DIPCM|nr:hypothetical protein O6H91_Y476700 [Diphasiastrum complanatum]KAJ7528751.1 hypothetical protein O6H91_15G017400 [Diphasiastrum complanatum]
MLLCSFITLLVHIPVCYILVFKLDIGNIGAALASSLSGWLNVALLLMYIRFSKTCSKTWISFSREAFHDLKGFLKLAIHSAMMVCLEWWAFEMALLFSGMLPNPQLETSTLSIWLRNEVRKSFTGGESLERQKLEEILPWCVLQVLELRIISGELRHSPGGIRKARVASERLRIC